MDKSLFFQAIGKFLLGLVLVALLLFLPAGSLRYTEGWLFLGLLFIPMFLAGLYMLWRSPELLRKRLQAREQEMEQKQVLAWSGLMFLAAFIVAGLNYRFSWCVLPRWLIALSCVIFLLAYLLYAEVLRENAWLSRTIEVQEDQKVVDKGLYGLVRHPMYAATLFLFLSMPLILNSPISFLILLAYIPIIVKRIKNEEKVLEAGLNGYLEYEKRVRYRLVPLIW